MITSGPLAGVKVVAFEAIGPVPLACQILSDMGAEVVTVARPPSARSSLPSSLLPTSTSVGPTVGIDCKDPAGVACVMALIGASDVVIEGFRPGVMERLGIGPDVVRSAHEHVVYARVTGWGQAGPYATMAGHDINYIGLTGALAAIGTRSSPVPPLNLVGDYAGGSMFAVAGILAALVSRASTGVGDVIDIAMTDGSAALMQPIRQLQEMGLWKGQREANLLDGGAPFYRTYETGDGRFMAVGALEPEFYRQFVVGLGLTPEELPDRFDPDNWDELAQLFGGIFASRSAEFWTDAFAGTDACVTPVVTIAEVMDNPHNVERGAILDTTTPPRAAPAPRFASAATQDEIVDEEPRRMMDVLTGVGMSRAEVDRLTAAGVVVEYGSGR